VLDFIGLVEFHIVQFADDDFDVPARDRVTVLRHLKIDGVIPSEARGQPAPNGSGSGDLIGCCGLAGEMQHVAATASPCSAISHREP
jgi:hypothetical protein